MSAAVPAVELLLAGSDRLTFELRNGQPWASPAPHVVRLDGREVHRDARNVFTLGGLAPDRAHAFAIETGGAHLRIEARTAACGGRLDVRDFGAVGDGRHDDTAALQAALACCPDGATVVLPAGTWLSGPLFLRSRTALHLDAGACLLGHPDVARWPLLPAALPAPGATRVLGSWEGRPAACHASLLNVVDAEDVRIGGDGTIDANASFDTWWSRPKTPFAGWRPRTLLLAHARRVAVEGLTFRNAPAWTIHALRSRELLFARLAIEAPADSPNTDGIDPESCEDVRILGCRIDTGDDCIAIKSGKPGPEGAPPPSRRVRIGNCLLQRGHGAVVLGSECAGGIHDVEARDCVFDGTDRGLRIKTRRGRGRDAVIADVRLRGVRMRGVGTPLVVNSFYWCDPDGREPHVGDRAPRPLDAGTPTVRDLAVERVDCVDVAHAAAYVLGLPERPVAGLRIRGLRVRYAADAAPGHPDMAAGIPALRRSGLTFENVRGLMLEDIDVAGADGPLYAARNVEPMIHDEDTTA